MSMRVASAAVAFIFEKMSTICIPAGPTNTIKTAGKIKSNVGKITWTDALCARSSA